MVTVNSTLKAIYLINLELNNPCGVERYDVPMWRSYTRPKLTLTEIWCAHQPQI